MERRYQARLEELLDDTEIRPGLLRGLLPRLETFLAPFVKSLCSREQRRNAQDYLRACEKLAKIGGRRQEQEVSQVGAGERKSEPCCW